MNAAATMSIGPLKMRANRKVVEARCAICERGFELAEEVYACPFCGGYHHVPCWGANLSCAASGKALDGGEPSSVMVAPEEATSDPPALAPDERRCSACSKVIKRDALKCRFCGTFFDSKVAVRIAPEKMPSLLAAEAEDMASKSLICAIVACFILAPILGPLAISKGKEALNILGTYPQHPTWARGKARAGIAIGVIGLIFFMIEFLARIGSY